MTSIVQIIVDAIVWVYALMATVPFVPFLIIWFIVYFFKKEKKLATKRAMDITTALLIGVVSALYNKVFQSSFGFYFLLLLFLLAFGLLGNAQHRSKGKIDWWKITRAVWRIGFLGLTAAYVILMTAVLF